MLNQKQSSFLSLASRSAVRAERLYGVPAEVTLAQAILESGWGAAAPGNNCFGVKANSRVPDKVLVATHEEFAPGDLLRWDTQHPDRPARDPQPLANGKCRVTIDAEFAAYPSLDAGFEDHAILLSSVRPYDVMLTKFEQNNNILTYVEEVASKYATDSAYAKNILAVMSMHPVQDALEEARSGAAKA